MYHNDVPVSIRLIAALKFCMKSLTNLYGSIRQKTPIFR